MKAPCGARRKLTDRQISDVLKWHQEGTEFRRAHGTLSDLAHVLGVSLHAVRGCFEIGAPVDNHRVPMSHLPHRPGRPRHLNPAQIAFALAWRRAGSEFRARHGTVASLARILGVGTSTIHDCIHRKGRYTQGSEVTVGHAAARDNAARAALLSAWLRPNSKR
jgi:hypothetical protein